MKNIPKTLDEAIEFLKSMKNIPQTLDEAIEFLFRTLSQADIEFIKSNDPVSAHHSGGMSLLNGWGLWRKDSHLVADIKKRFNLFGHGDDCSGLIFAGLWAKVKGEDVTKCLTDEAEKYCTHWKNMGVNPETGQEVAYKQSGHHIRVECLK